MRISDWSSDVCSSDLDDRHIDHRLRAPTEPVAALDRKAFGAGLHAKFARVGLDGNTFDEPADRACAIESALRSFQHLDPLAVIGHQVDRELAGTIIDRTRSDGRVDRTSPRLNSSH